MPSDFEQCAAGRQWYPDPLGYDHLAFGEQSLLTQAMVQAADSSEYPPVIAGIDALLDCPDQLPAYLGEDEGYPIEQGVSVLQGFRDLLDGLRAWSASRSAAGLREAWPSFERAIEGFEAAWGGGPRQAVGSVSAVQTTIRDDPLWEAFADCGRSQTCAGFWSAWDLLDRLRGNLDTSACRFPVVGTATTPVLLVRGSPEQGHVHFLTVELLSGGGSGFDPDPLFLGLTAVRNQPQNHVGEHLRGSQDLSHVAEHLRGSQDINHVGEHLRGSHPVSERPGHVDFIDSLRAVWEKSGAGAGLRGRWRITAQLPSGHPYRDDPRFRDLPPQYVRRLSGRSAEAAALAAIWTAGGSIPYEPPFRLASGLALSPDVAITASLGERPATGPLAAIPLGRVLSIGPKLRAAQAARLDTVLLASDEQTSAEEQQLMQQQRAGAGSDGSLRPERVATLGDALDRMLETGRAQRFWQEYVEQKWQASWSNVVEGE